MLFEGGMNMGAFNKLCVFCLNKKGLLNEGFYCEITGEDLDQQSDLFRFGCDGGCTGRKYCEFYQEDR